MCAGVAQRWSQASGCLVAQTVGDGERLQQVRSCRNFSVLPVPTDEMGWAHLTATLTPWVHLLATAAVRFQSSQR
jgi:hypothetical protein